MAQPNHQSSSKRCFRGLRHVNRQDQVSAELFVQRSKKLFLKSGTSQLRILHERGYESPGTTEDESGWLSGSAGTLVNEKDLENGYVNIDIDKSNSESEQRSGVVYSVTNAQQLDQLLISPSRFSGFAIMQESSWSRLNVTYEVFEALRARLGVSYSFGDTIMYMGYREHEIEIAPPPLRWRAISNGTDLQSLSGWQCSFMLRYIQLNYGDTDSPWSLRQFAMYNSYDEKTNRSTNLFVAPPEEIIHDFMDVFHEDMCDTRTSCITMQVNALRTVVAFWRPYIVWVANELAQYSLQITFGDPLRRRPLDVATDDTGERLRTLEGSIDDAILSLQANQKTVFALGEMWRRCGVDDRESQDEFIALDSIIDEFNAGFDTHILQLQNLKHKAMRNARTVSEYRDLASGVHLQNNGKSLEKLAVAAQADSVAVIDLTKRAQEDAAAVKALTLLALIYLPISVVLNFFSTELVKVSDSHIILAPHWWLFLAIGLPLTIFTLLLWQIWIFLKKEKSENAASMWSWDFWRLILSKDSESSEKGMV